MHKNYKTYEYQSTKVEKYVEFIHKYGPYRFFATLSFQYKLNDYQGIDFASKFVRRLLKKLFGKHWKKHGVKCLAGLATLEHASILKRVGKESRRVKDRGSCHFHFLLHDHPCFDHNPDVALRQLTDAWEKAAHGLNYKATRKLVSANGTDVQLIQTNGIYGYILKEAKNPSWRNEERLFFLDGEGLLSIDASPF